MIGVLVIAGCARKPTNVAPAAPEVLVTTVAPRDVPRVLERVATLDGFINANINAQVQGYIVSRDYKEGSVVKKGDLLFQIDPRPFEAALAQAKGTLARDVATPPTQTEPPFRLAQLTVLALSALFCLIALIRFHPERDRAA